MTFATPNDLAQWLKVNYATERALWVKIFKEQFGVLSVTWEGVVVESLCWVGSMALRSRLTIKRIFKESRLEKYEVVG